jgi:hypothetical protein
VPVLVCNGVEIGVETDLDEETEVDLTCWWAGSQFLGGFGSIYFFRSLQ